MKVKIGRIDKSLPLPEYHTEGSVGFDMYSRVGTELNPKEVKLLPSNLIVEVPKGYVLLISARSSSSKRGLRLSNGIGVIDQDYHGPDDEIGILAYNFTDKPVKVEKGERIAQGLILPVERADWEEVDEMGDASRGGFGSTG
jgi:dUTP pyrophosphatase